MSWFSELTSKAEAMLVKLDQETAQALQNPAQILPKSIVFDGNIRDNEIPDQVHQSARDTQTYNDLASDGDGPLLSDAENGAQDNSVPDSNGFESNDGTVNSELISNSQDYAHNVIQQDMMRPSDASRNVTPEQEAKYDQALPVTLTTDTPSQSRKFKLQTSKLRPTLHNNEEAKVARTNGYRQPLERENPIISLGADDIRASINKSLQEYSQSSSQVRWREELPEPTTYSSHFDNRPNLVTTEDNDHSGKLHSSPSFSIDVPDDSDHSTNITSQILSQSALRNKSPFNLHKVINKLASQRGHSQSLLGDKTKIRLRRAQMRAASYLRRMNYYFQTYPTMKYWMIGYLVLLQILVVYVLFFYQSSGSSSYLINQVKQQQEELAEPSQQQHPNSERIHPYSGEQQHTNSR